MSIAKFHGVVTKCSCTNPDVQMFCALCMCRGFQATCLNCSGTGQMSAPTYGASGTMKSTCDKCGGRGKFPANKPEGWDEIEKQAVLLEELQGIVPSFAQADFTAREPVLASDALSEAARSLEASSTEFGGGAEATDESDVVQDADGCLPMQRPSGYPHKQWDKLDEQQRRALIESKLPAA